MDQEERPDASAEETRRDESDLYWEPGVVAVELREGVQPEVIGAPGAGPYEVTSLTNTNLSQLNQALQHNQLMKAEPTFQTPREEAAKAQERAQSQGVSVPNLTSFITLYFPPGTDLERIIRELNQLPEVERAARVPKVIPPLSPLSEPLLGTTDQLPVLIAPQQLERQWYIFRCGIDLAWTLATGKNVVIANIDRGVRTTHVDLVPRLDMGKAYNSFDGTNNVSRGNLDHGTAVMGILGAAADNSGMVGIAHEADLWPIQANKLPGPGLPGNSWANAIERVRMTSSGGKKKVILLEAQTASELNIEIDITVNAAIRTAIGSDITVCIPAGNSGRDAAKDASGNSITPTGSILVGATLYHDVENRRAPFSNFGREVIFAPGDPRHDLTCCGSHDSCHTNRFGRTSGAAPKVAATVALMLQVNPGLRPSNIKNILLETGTPVITDPTKPTGPFLDSHAAVLAAIDAL